MTDFKFLLKLLKSYFHMSTQLPHLRGMASFSFTCLT